jgi:hypothetical protein
MNSEDSYVEVGHPVDLHKTPPPGYRIRDRELPQRLLGAILWIALFVILWRVGAR